MSSRGVRLTLVGLMVVANLALWIPSSNVLELVARQRPVLLGRYSKERINLILALIPATALAAYLLLATRETIKQRVFRTVAVLGGLMIALIPADCLLLAVGEPYPYRYENSFATRVPDRVTEVVIRDVPLTARSYPNAAPGHPDVKCRFTTDGRGYRNAPGIERADIVVLGDSFAEGKQVSDEHVFPALLASRSSRSVYNLGLAGSDPAYYDAALRRHGIGLSPEHVISMIYGGNDFREDGTLPDPLAEPLPFDKRVKMLRKASPIRNGVQNLILACLGPLRAGSEFPGQRVLGWMPVEVPAPSGSTYYAFAPRRLAELYQTSEELSASPGWKTVELALKAIHARCEKAGARLLVVYAPSKPEVIFPLVEDRLPADDVRAFLGLRKRKLPSGRTTLPAGPELLAELMACLPARTTVLAEHCERSGVPYLDVTPMLREATREGRQTYFTYDDHWTPEGHRIVADAIAAKLGR